MIEMDMSSSNSFDISINEDKFDVDINTSNSLDTSVEFDSDIDFETEVVQNDFDIEFAEAIIVQGERLPNYEGEYNVIPRVNEQTLNTKDRSMVKDVKVEAIPYVEVTNVGGGYTATIG